MTATEMSSAIWVWENREKIKGTPGSNPGSIRTAYYASCKKAAKKMIKDGVNDDNIIATTCDLKPEQVAKLRTLGPKPDQLTARDYFKALDSDGKRAVLEDAGMRRQVEYRIDPNGDAEIEVYAMEEYVRKLGEKVGQIDDIDVLKGLANALQDLQFAAEEVSENCEARACELEEEPEEA